MRPTSFSESLFGLFASPFNMDENLCLGAKGRKSEIRELPTGGSRKDLFSEERGGRRNQKSPGRKAEAQAQFAAATEVVSNFCGNYPALHVQPSEEEMERVLQRCCEMRPVAVAKAFHGELSWSSGDLSWQPRFRALCALEHFGRQSKFGWRVLRKCASEAQELLRYLIQEMPQCRAGAERVLEAARHLDDVEEARGDATGDTDSPETDSPGADSTMDEEVTRAAVHPPAVCRGHIGLGTSAVRQVVEEAIASLMDFEVDASEHPRLQVCGRDWMIDQVCGQTHYMIEF